MSKSKFMKILDGRNIALIYIFSAFAYILYYARMARDEVSSREQAQRAGDSRFQ